MAAQPSPLFLVPSNLPDLVKEKFSAARAAGALTFWATQVHVLHINGISFQLRYSPSIAHKPKSTNAGEKKKPVDPFLQPPEALLIADLGRVTPHILVLNKFAIVPEHFILATKVFREQTHLLDEGDLAATYACLQTWKNHGKELFAFFNSGEHSGASQPHRHIQLLPVDSMMNGLGQGDDWHPLVDKLASSPKLDLPFTYFAASFSRDVTAAEIHKLYTSLHGQARNAVESYLSLHPEDRSEILLSGPIGSSSFSYNLGLTDRSMVLIPRRAEGSMISAGADDSTKVGPIALNGTVLAGTLLVKNESEWNAMKGDSSQLSCLLEVIGIPSPDFKSEKLDLPPQVQLTSRSSI